MNALEILTKEHGLIRQFLDNLSMAVEKIENGENPKREFFDRSLDFVQDFINKYHHFKEEYVMFGRLAQKKEGDLDAQIEALRNQHDHTRNFIVEISNYLDGYSKGEEFHTTKLLENLAAYISTLRRHMVKEDHIFYPMVEKELSDKEHQSLLSEFQKEEKKSGGDTFENNRKLVLEIGSLLTA